MQHFFKTALLLFIYINAEESCTKFPKLADNTPVPIQTTNHEAFVTPDCESLNMKAILDLQCLDGEYFLVDPSGEHKMPANGKDFCFDPTDPLGDAGDHTHHREILQKFWKHLQVTLEKALQGCPMEALECFKFDNFANEYLPGRLEELDEFFLGLQLDVAAALDFNVYIDEYVREFSFASGMKGHVIEFQNGMIYATINSEGEDDFSIYIRPCNKEEGETCDYVIYREKKIEGHVWSEEDVADELIRQDPTVAGGGYKLDMKGIIHERLAQHGLEGETRRYLQSSNNVALTFLYDPAIQTLADANAKSAEIVLDFNDALGEHDGSGFRLLRRALVAVPENNFNNDHGSCCGSSVADCVSDKNVMQACRDEANSLPPTQMGHLHHCFAHKNSFQGGTIGCGGKNNVGVTTLHNGHTTNIAIHEIAHQLGAPHKSHCWCATQIVWCWKTECSIMNPSVTNTVRRFHIESVSAMKPAANDHGDTFLLVTPSAKTIIPKIPDITNGGESKSRKILAVTVISAVVVFIVFSLLFLRRKKQIEDRRYRQELLESLISKDDEEGFTHSAARTFTCTPLTPYQGNDNARSQQSEHSEMGLFSQLENTDDTNSDVSTFSTLSSTDQAVEPFVEPAIRQYVTPRMGSFSRNLSWDDLEEEYETRANGPINEAENRVWWPNPFGAATQKD